MAEFRSIHTKMWRDEWFSNLPPEGKVLFVYLITNPAASVCGMYQLPDKFIAFDTGLDLTTVQLLKEEFRKADKIDFDGDVIWVKKMREYQDPGNSPKVAVRIAKDISSLPNCRIKGIYCDKYGIDRVSVGYPEMGSDTDTDTDTDTVKPTAQKKRGNSELFAIATALAEVCQMDLEANKGRLMKEAKLLSKATPTPTPELLRQYYNGSSEGFWRTKDWRGKKGQVPNPANVRETWGKWGIKPVDDFLAGTLTPEEGEALGRKAHGLE